MPRNGILLAALYVSVVGCSEKGVVADTATRWDSSGIEVVEHGQLGIARPLRFEVEYLMEVPESAAAESGHFGSIADADLLPNGNLAVLDRFAAEVRVFSPQGRFVRRIGRQGSGPGEFSGGTTLNIISLQSGDIALPDIANRAFVVFDSGGSHRENIAFDTREAAPQWRELSADTVAVLIGMDRQRIERRLLGSDWRDTLVISGASSPAPSPDGRWPLLPDHLLWDVARPDRVATAQMSESNIRLYEGSHLRRLIRWHASEDQLSEEEVNTLLGIAARAMGDPSGDPETARNRMAVPERAHVMADIAVGRNIILAQRMRPVEEMDQRILSTFGAAGFGGPTWDVFLWSGEYLGVVDFGENVDVFQLRGDSIVGIREDDTGSTHPFVARLPQKIWQTSR